MKASEVRLYIDGDLVSTTPIYSDSISIEKVRESGEMYRRTKLNSEFKFVGSDYDLIFDSSLDTSFEVRVYDKESDTLLARGTFEKTDCKFNEDDKICTVKATSADEYDKLLAGLGNEFDLVGLAPVRESVTLKKRAILQIYFGGDTKVTNIIGNMSYEVDTSDSVTIDGESVEVAKLEAEQLEKFSFTYYADDSIHISLFGDALESIPDAEGKYIFSRLDGTTRIYEHKDGEYTLKMTDTEVDEGIIRVEGWLYDSNNTKVYVDGLSIYVRFQLGVESIYAGVWYYHEGNPSYVGDRCGYVNEFRSRGYFARVLLDNPNPDTPMGTIRKLSEGNDILPYNLNYRYAMPINVGGFANNIVISNEVQSEPTKWGVNGDGDYFVQPSPKNVGDNVIPIGWNRWIPFSYWFNSTPSLADILDLYDTEWVLNDAYPLWSAIDVLLAQIDDEVTFYGTSVYSQFLYGEISQEVIYGWEKQLLYITPITNVKRTYYNQAARKGKITLKQILDMLRAFNLYWFLDENKRLRIEHITWFMNGGNYAQQSPLVDLTSIISPMSKKNWSFGQNAFDFDKSSLTKRYEFGWNEECTEAFDGFAIDIRNRYVRNASTSKMQVSNFISDVDLIISAPDALGDDSFALIGTNDEGSCPIETIGNFGMDFIAPQYKMQNPYLSFFFLELAYWLYNMSGDNARTSDYKKASGDDGELRVQSIKRFKTQSIKFPMDASLVGDEGLIATEIGVGEWVSSTYNAEDGMVDMQIVMEDNGGRATIVDYGQFVRMNEGFMSLAVSGNITFVISGNDGTIGDWGYLKITAKKDVRVTMTASTSTNNGIGWADGEPHTSFEDAEDAEYTASGTQSQSFTLDEGDVIYIGYAKNANPSGAFNTDAFSDAFAKEGGEDMRNDKITFSIVEV